MCVFFLLQNRINHTLFPPYKMVRHKSRHYIQEKRVKQASEIAGTATKQNLNKFLMNYRNSPQIITENTLTELFL